MFDKFSEKMDGGIARLTINRPEARNAMSDDMWESLRESLDRYANDRSVRCVVISGAGDSFCAGGDVKSFPNGKPGGGEIDIEARINHLRRITQSIHLLHEMPKPTLAVIPGPAAGAGFCLALACDMRIAAESARFTTAFARIGTAGDFGGSYFLTKMVGAARSRELYFTSQILSASDALALGIVNRIEPDESLHERAEILALELSNGPTVALGYMKKNLNAAMSHSLKDVLDLEAAHMIRTIMTEDYRNASRAFMEKRQPTFSGK